jgi:ABC-type Fe3+-hydroxamate transport system substrate-binding protein
VALDLPLVAVGIWGGAADPSDVAAPFVPVDLTGVEILNTEQQNIETILVLDPDLIISREFYLGESFLEGALTSAAPILPVASRGPWRPDLEQAAWLEREEALDEVLAEYEALRDEVAQRHAEAPASAQVAIVEWYGPDANFYAGGLDDFQLQANTLGELGGQLIPFQQGRDYFAEPFSIEKVGELAAADAILLVGPHQSHRLHGAGLGPVDGVGRSGRNLAIGESKPKNNFPNFYRRRGDS